MASIVRRIAATPTSLITSPKWLSARLLLLSIPFSSSPLDTSYSESPFSSLQTDSDNESSLSQTSAAGPENPKPLFKERPLESGLDVGIYKAILVGEVGQNPLQKTLRSGRKVTLISVGTGGIRNNRRPLDNEDPREYANRCSVQWHRVSVYPERLGDTVMKHAKPGTILYVEGNLESKIFNDPITGLVRRIREVAVRRNGMLKTYSIAMLQNSKFFRPPMQPVCSQLPSLQPPHLRSALGQNKIKPCSLDLDHLGKHTRRALAISTSPLLLFLASQALDPFNILEAKARDIENEEAPASVTEQQENETSSCSDTVPTKRAFIEISIDGQPQGRVVIGLYGNSVPGGAARFSSLVSGSAGVSYRRKEFTKIMPNYIQHGGVRSYGVDAEMAKKTGSDLGSERLAEEWERQNVTCQGTKMVAGSVGIVARDPLKPPPKIKLVARKGKLEIDEEEVRRDPNGTEFVVAWKDSPGLDASVLVVGRVLEGLDVVEKIGQVKKVQENTSSPYFRVAKLIGDKRAVVAERGFNRPYSKVVVTNCGLID